MYVVLYSMEESGTLGGLAYATQASIGQVTEQLLGQLGGAGGGGHKSTRARGAVGGKHREDDNASLTSFGAVSQA